MSLQMARGTCAGPLCGLPASRPTASARPVQLAAQPCRQSGPLAPRQPPRQRGAPAAAAIRAVESYEAGFELAPEQSEILNDLLYNDLFYQQVVRDCRLPEGTKVEFTGVLFQPRPWTPTATKGMPVDVEEQYYGKPEEFQFINVPPVFMFQAKIFAPQRLCAIYKRL